jgi:ferritin heavy chain
LEDIVGEHQREAATVNMMIRILLTIACVSVVFAQEPAESSCKGNPGSPYCTLPLYHFHDNIEGHLVKQLNREIDASLFYLELASYFGRDDVNRPGFAKFFLKASDEERDHAKKINAYLNERDGYWTGYSIAGGTPLTKPQPSDMEDGYAAIKYCLALEKEVSSKLTDLHRMASKHQDVHLADWLESDLLREQVSSVRELTGMMSNLYAMKQESCYSLAEHLYDQQLLAKD